MNNSVNIGRNGTKFVPIESSLQTAFRNVKKSLSFYLLPSQILKLFLFSAGKFFENANDLENSPIAIPCSILSLTDNFHSVSTFKARFRQRVACFKITYRTSTLVLYYLLRFLCFFLRINQSQGLTSWKHMLLCCRHHFRSKYKYA